MRWIAYLVWCPARCCRNVLQHVFSNSLMQSMRVFRDKDTTPYTCVKCLHADVFISGALVEVDICQWLFENLLSLMLTSGVSSFICNC